MMLRNTAREIAVHLAYELSFTALPVEELLETRLNAERFAELAGEDALYQEAPDQLQRDYIARLVTGVSEHAAELDGYIAKYARGWKFSRIPLVASAIMRVAMYEILYMPEIPNGAAINEAVEIAKHYETPEMVKFINGILGSFARQELPDETGTRASRRPAFSLQMRENEGRERHGAQDHQRQRAQRRGEAPAG